MTPEEKSARGAEVLARKQAVFHAKTVRHAHGIETPHVKGSDPVPSVPVQKEPAKKGSPTFASKLARMITRQ